ncbi:MAG TPA: hypothetical protein VKU19_35775, partial [Bryobacteraceae bacterium]|nr:hypothetical protein [Bryobacteraceae bacterium]
RVPWRRKVNVKKKNTKILPFRAPLEQRDDRITIFSLGDKRIAVRWEVTELPPAAPLLEWRRATKKPISKIVK